MDIEILRDIAEQVRHNYEQGHAIGFNLDDHCHYELAYGLKSMLEEAIARQSVKSEDVQREINRLTDALKQTKEAAKELKEQKYAVNMLPVYNQIKSLELQITALQAYQPWIPVSERLPKNSEHDWVLAQITEDNGYMWIPKVVEYRERIGDWYCEELGWLKTHNGTFKVTHWKPLPEPPKGE